MNKLAIIGEVTAHYKISNYPLRVAYYRAVSASPEMEAWEIMAAWIKEAGSFGRNGCRI